MRQKTRIERQYMACGYEPRTDRTHLTIWQPPSGNDRVGYKGPALKTCAGFTVNLPEVIEVICARPHWKNGSIAEAFEHKPTDHTMACLVVFDAQCSALESWLMVPAADGGGGS